MAIFGIVLLVLVAILLSDRRQNINLRVVGTTLLLQMTIAVFVFFVPFGQASLGFVAGLVQSVIDFSNTGIAFIFGGLTSESIGFVFAIQVLPVIIFFSSLMSLLYHLKVMQLIVRGLGKVLHLLLGTGRVESLCAAANIFFDQSQSPLVVRPYLKDLTESQFFAVMACGLASISGSILAGYASIGIRLDYLVTASFMAAPGGLLMAKLIVPEKPGARDDAPLTEQIGMPGTQASNVVEAVANGALDGLRLAASIGGMLLAFIALIAMLNGVVGSAGEVFGVDDLTVDSIFGYLFAPVVYLLGIPWSEAATAGNLIGQKLVLNEFVAFIGLAEVQEDLSPRSLATVTFALCGFANFASVAILMGGLGSLVPERKPDIARRALKVVAAGTLSNLMSAAIVNLVLTLQGV